MNDQLTTADIYDSFCQARERRSNLFPRSTVTPQLVFDELKIVGKIHTWEDVRISNRANVNRLSRVASEVLVELREELRGS